MIVADPATGRQFTIPDGTETCSISFYYGEPGAEYFIDPAAVTFWTAAGWRSIQAATGVMSEAPAPDNPFDVCSHLAPNPYSDTRPRSLVPILALAALLWFAVRD